ncbi:MAG TPA: hypothetical protein VH436_14155 [Vicinamibacterales bacterium]
MVRRALTVVLVNAVVFVMLIEALGLMAYYEDTGHLFYLHSKTYEPIPETKAQRLTFDGLHPYFGPTHAPGAPFDIPESLRDSASPATRLATNNFGFVAPFDYPFVKTSDRQFVIGLLGGSVGAWFCQVGAHRLVENLKHHPYFATRDIVPVCVSHEGYKQPQQLIVLAYFLSIGQSFDLVINIDGFNEVTLGSLNEQRGLDISMPSAMHLEPLVNLVDRASLTPEKLRSLNAIEEYKERINRLVARLGRTRSAAVHFVLDRLYRSARRSYQQELGHFSNLPSNSTATSLILATPPVKTRTDATVFDDIAASWIRSSMSMKALLDAREIPYVQVLQPNQYHTTRRFSAEEAKIARAPSSPFKTGVERGYPVLLKAADAAQLTKALTFLDATHIFDTEPSPVYIDDCCHYTLRGNQLLADFIATGVLGAPGPWSIAR